MNKGGRHVSGTCGETNVAGVDGGRTESCAWQTHERGPPLVPTAIILSFYNVGFELLFCLSVVCAA